MIDVAFTPATLGAARIAVMVDALRASATIVQALAGGYERVRCCSELERARSLAAPDRVLAGERGCVRPAGFDLGNSPREHATARARELVLTTTNGCPALLAAATAAPRVLIGALVNLDAVVRALAGVQDILIVCAGTDGHPALEDAYVAGWLVEHLRVERSDAAEIAAATARAFPNPPAAFAAAADAAVLRRVGLEEDIEWCAQLSTLSVVPVLEAIEDEVAIVRTDNPRSMRSRGSAVVPQRIPA